MENFKKKQFNNMKKILLLLLLCPILSFGQATGRELSNFATSGSIGSASTTVDVYSRIYINQTTASIILTIPNPTNTTTKVVEVWIGNKGTVPFTLNHGGVIDTACGVILKWVGGSYGWNVIGKTSNVDLSDYIRLDGTSDPTTGDIKLGFEKGYKWSNNVFVYGKEFGPGSYMASTVFDSINNTGTGIELYPTISALGFYNDTVSTSIKSRIEGVEVETNSKPVYLRTDSTTTAYTIQLPNKTGVQVAAMLSDIGSSGVSSVSGTAGRVTSTGGSTPVIDIDNSFIATPVETKSAVNSYTINCVGDSETFGYLGEVAGGYPSALTRLYGRNTLNNGITGQTSTQIKERFLVDSSKFGLSTIIYSGTNNFSASATVQSDIASMVASLGHTRYVIVGVGIGAGQGNPSGVPTTAYTQITALNSALSSTYGVRYFDINAYFATLGDGSAQDNQDIADGIIPTSKRSDNIHFNTTGYTALATGIYTQKINYLTDIQDKLVNLNDLATSQVGKTGSFSFLQSSGGGYQPSLGTELVTNGTFPSFTGWTAGANWSVVSNTALHTSGSTATLTQNVAIVSTNQYIVTVTVSGRTTGSVTLTLGSLVGNYNISSNGTFTYSYFATGGGSTALTFTPTSTFNGALSVVSIKPISAFVRANTIFYNRDKDPGTALEIRPSTSFGYNMFGGYNAGRSAYNCSYTLGWGYGALAKASTTNNCTAINNSSPNLVAGDDNITIGVGTLNAAYKVDRCVVIGNQGANSNTGNDIVGTGNNIWITNTTGNQNTGNGSGGVGNGNTTGSGHTVSGYNTRCGATQSNNTVTGINSFNGTATGSGQNSVYGGLSLTSVTTASRCFTGGYSVGNSLTTGNFCIGLGAWCDFPSATLSGQLNIGNVIYGLNMYSTNSNSSTPTANGSIGIGLTTPTARLHLSGGTATASTAPLKFTSGTNLTTPENGAVEFDGNNLSLTVNSTRNIVRLDSYVGVSATYPVVITDATVNATANTFTITLPTAVGITGKTFTIKNSGAGTITIATTSSQTIDGTTTKILNVQYSGIIVQSNGTNYIIIGTI